MKLTLTSRPNGTYTVTVPTEEGNVTLFSAMWTTDAGHRDPYDAMSDLVRDVFKTNLPPLRELNFDKDGTAEINVPIC